MVTLAKVVKNLAVKIAQNLQISSFWFWPEDGIEITDYSSYFAIWRYSYSILLTIVIGKLKWLCKNHLLKWYLFLYKTILEKYFLQKYVSWIFDYIR